VKKRTNPFRLRTKSPQPEEIPPKTAPEMTDAELEESLRQARKELLDVRHEELREREKARIAPEDAGRTKPRNLGEIFKKRGFK
jgi:hypothetical protein